MYPQPHLVTTCRGGCILGVVVAIVISQLRLLGDYRVDDA